MCWGFAPNSAIHIGPEKNNSQGELFEDKFIKMTLSCMFKNVDNSMTCYHVKTLQTNSRVLRYRQESWVHGSRISLTSTAQWTVSWGLSWIGNKNQSK